MNYRIYYTQQLRFKFYFLTYNGLVAQLLDDHNMRTARTSHIEQLIQRVKKDHKSPSGIDWSESNLYRVLVSSGRTCEVHSCDKIEDLFILKETNPELFV